MNMHFYVVQKKIRIREGYLDMTLKNGMDSEECMYVSNNIFKAFPFFLHT